MKLTEELVDRLAGLSRLRLTGEERLQLAEELAHVLEYMALLEELDDSGMEPAAQGPGLKNVFRPDEAEPSMDRASLLKNAPSQDGAAVLVPRAVEWGGGHGAL